MYTEKLLYIEVDQITPFTAIFENKRTSSIDPEAISSYACTPPQRMVTS
jgi:hypothetical protein